MIASTPVARWTWGDYIEGEDQILRCLTDLLAAKAVLAAHRLVVGEPRIRLTVSESGKPRETLYEGELPANGTAEELAAEVRAAMRPGPIGSAGTTIVTTGMVLGPEGEVRTEGLFLLSTSTYTDFAAVALMTYSDAWMPFDLRGRPQPAVHEANAPRLAAALAELTDALGSEMDPEDPTYFGTPTATGVNPHFDRAGVPSDTWSRFELLRRYGSFTHAPGFGHSDYRRTVDGDVRYVPIADDHGTLGYLWASDAEDGASFEPVDVDDEERYRAAHAWLGRLRSAHHRKLSPTQALTELTGRSPENTEGPVALATLRRLAAWSSKSLPVDQEAAARLSAWVTAVGREPLRATGLDLRGADLSDGDLEDARLAQAVLAGVSLAGAGLWNARLEKSDLTGANLTGAVLVGATLDLATLRSACLDRASLTSASLIDVDATATSFRRADLTNTTLLQVDLRGADLTDAVVANTSFTVHVDDHTVLRGLSGTLFGPVTVVTGDSEQELDGVALQRWLTDQGADVEVLSGFLYYALFNETCSREDPFGLVRQSTADGIDVDEAFTRNLRWEPTEYLRRYYLGHNDTDHAEITRAEAEAFIARVKQTLGERDRARSMLDRLTAVDWRDEDAAYAHAASRSRLFREYLRRSALWAQAYQPGQDWPFVDLAAHVDPTVQVDAELAEQLDAFLEANVGFVKAKALCRAALRWAALLDGSTVHLPELADPFEPLLRMFERGGWCGLVIENRVADFFTLRVPFGRWQDHLGSDLRVE
ncbi:pentapeptide repeat-containing protein [Kitasatospora sp. NPDC093558]|uniref:pentapeptide repeat-containing protein n=1 Tax=Kitasatospora sp. NPDC093558 TaxID=3155201 RepID=UPI0034258097